MNINKSVNILFALCLFFALTAATAFAQTTQFTYQGRLLDNSMPPTASYDFEFRLFSVNGGGTAIGTIQRPGVAVSNGIFTVQLDFGAQFDGTPRYLEIAVKPTSGGSLTTLNPRQQINSAPYNIRSLSAANADTSATAATANNALQLGGAAANQFVQTTDGRLSDNRSPLPGSANYIQNRSTTQTSTGFNIDGTGRADIFNAATQYNLGGVRVLGVDNTQNNLFVGAFAGQTSQGIDNSFFGRSAGFSNSSGGDNTFSGFRSGFSNTTGIRNSFFGSLSGESNQGSDNAFFGQNSGNANTGGGNDSFFGARSGKSNINGASNSFFGTDAGGSNTNADGNSFFGNSAGYSTTTGNSNSFFGDLSGDGNTNGANNSFFGSNAGAGNTGGSGNVFIGKNAGDTNVTGDFNTVIGNNADVVGDNLNHATAIGAGAVVATSNTIYMGRTDGSDTVRVPGAMVLGTLGTAGSTTLCRNASNFIATCSSSLRYKTNVAAFTSGLDVVKRLRPIAFDWKEGGMHDVGFAAEEVNQIEPLLTTINAGGEIEGVKYAQLTTVLVNALKEQQTQIEDLQGRLKKQQALIDGLRKLVCPQNPQTDICREEQPK